MKNKKIIAFSGAHGSGKTTAALSLTYQLKKKNINSGFVPSSSRNSLYLAGKNTSEEMHLEICYLQMTNEIQGSMSYDIIVTDRSVFDFYIYGLIRHPESKEFLSMLKNICVHHSILYKDIIFMDECYTHSKIDISQINYYNTMKEFFKNESIKNITYPPYNEDNFINYLSQNTSYKLLP